MPETTQTATFARPAEQVFDLVADFGSLSEWDPMFDRSERLDVGHLDVGSRFHATGSVLGKTIDLDLEVVEYQRPHRVVFEGKGDGLSTTEEIWIQPTPEGCELTYRSAFETDERDLLDAATKPAYVAIGKRAIDGMQEWITG